MLGRSVKVTAASLLRAVLCIWCKNKDSARKGTKMVMLKLDDDLLSAFIFYGCLLGMKTAIMSFLTARHRLKNKVGVYIHVHLIA